VPIMRWVMVLWPGLPRLWLRGEWSAAFLAIGFSALVNLLIAATWGWTELLTLPVLLSGWSGTVLFWLVSVAAALREMPEFLRVPSSDFASDLFRTAQGEYLRGNWFEAELALNRLLEHNPCEVDAEMMLATLLRRTGHAAEAHDRLNRLSMREGAVKWQFEIARERTLCTASINTVQDVHKMDAGDCGLPTAA
jgi:hypothetical protein